MNPAVKTGIIVIVAFVVYGVLDRLFLGKMLDKVLPSHYEDDND